MIINLGILLDPRVIDFEHLTSLTVMSVDYVKMYQNPDNANTRCNPNGFPTQAYINKCVSLFFVCLFWLVTDAIFSLPILSFVSDQFPKAYAAQKPAT